MIQIENLWKSFDGKDVLRGIDATFKPSIPNLVIGASGSGKSVMLKNLVGLIEPDKGKIMYGDEDFASMDYNEKQHIRRQIGMLFQNNALFDSMTVEQNIEFPLKMFTQLNPSERLDKVNQCLKMVDLVNSNKKYPSEISGGMKKRVGIARAIVLEIKYLFCDEPNSGLDPLTSRVIDELIAELTVDLGITTVINSHDMKTVKDIGENIIFIYKGEKWWQGSKDEIENARINNKELDAFISASF